MSLVIGQSYQNVDAIAIAIAIAKSKKAAASTALRAQHMLCMHSSSQQSQEPTVHVYLVDHDASMISQKLSAAYDTTRISKYVVGILVRAAIAKWDRTSRSTTGGNCKSFCHMIPENFQNLTA